jgi:hypothetical protein
MKVPIVTKILTAKGVFQLSEMSQEQIEAHLKANPSHNQYFEDRKEPTAKGGALPPAI